MKSSPSNLNPPQALEAVSTKNRPLLFLVAYLIAVIITTSFIVYPSMDDLEFTFNTFLAVIFFLPGGLVLVVNWILKLVGLDTELILFQGFSVQPANPLAGILILVSYLLCLGIPFAGIITTRQRTFRNLFLAFIALLVINIAGCSVMR